MWHFGTTSTSVRTVTFGTANPSRAHKLRTHTVVSPTGRSFRLQRALDASKQTSLSFANFPFRTFFIAPFSLKYSCRPIAHWSKAIILTKIQWTTMTKEDVRAIDLAKDWTACVPFSVFPFDTIYLGYTHRRQEEHSKSYGKHCSFQNNDERFKKLTPTASPDRAGLTGVGSLLFPSKLRLFRKNKNMKNRTVRRSTLPTQLTGELAEKTMAHESCRPALWAANDDREMRKEGPSRVNGGWWD